jgi:hypothetical protein
MKLNNWQLVDGIFSSVRNEDLLPEEDEKIDINHYDVGKVATDGGTGKRRLGLVIKDLHSIKDGIDEMLKHAENPDVTQDNFKLYVDGPTKEMVELLFKVAVHIKGVVRMLPAMDLCKSMDINTRKGTFKQ